LTAEDSVASVREASFAAAQVSATEVAVVAIDKAYVSTK
jgi:hypothetical protein